MSVPGGSPGQEFRLVAQPATITTRREHTLFFSLVILAAAFFIVAPLLKERGLAVAKVSNEDAALGAVFAIAEAERLYLEAHGRYGWIGDLVRDDLLRGYEVIEEDGRRYVLTPGYRTDLLLPHGREGAEGIAIAPRGPGQPPPHPELVARHMSVVARPLEPGVTGWRTWYLDERGDVFLNEGVVDVAGAMVNRLPTAQVLRTQSLVSGRPLLWQRLETLGDY